MKRITFWLLSTFSGLALLFSYSTSTAGSVASAGGALAAGASNGTIDPSKGAVTKVDGNAIRTRYGPVQVQISVQVHKIVAVKVLKLPPGAMDKFIAGRSVPTLIKETLKAQSAHIDIVTTATYTSNGYIKSLQSALDNAAL